MTFEMFFNEHYEPVRRSLAVAFADPVLAEELAQDAFTRALSNWRRVSQMEHPAGWVYVVALRAGRRRRLARVAAVTATIFAIVAVVVVAINRSTSDKQIVVAAPTTTVQPRPIAAMPDAQLRAHLGDGVPAGWQPVDFGDARVFVP